MNEEYNVGQVIYLLGRKSLNIIPALVVEEITRKTVDKTVSQFLIRLADKDATVVEIDAVSEDIFSNIEELKEYMFENTRRSVEALVDRAIEQRKEILGVPDPEDDVDKDDEDNKNVEGTIEPDETEGSDKLVQNNDNGVIINSVEQNFDEQLKLHA